MRKRLSSCWSMPPAATWFVLARISRSGTTTRWNACRDGTKRRSQWIIFVLGLTVAVGVNASTIDIAQKLATDSAVRNALVPLAQAAVAAKDTAAQPGQAAQARA